MLSFMIYSQAEEFLMPGIVLFHLQWFSGDQLHNLLEEGEEKEKKKKISIR